MCTDIVNIYYQISNGDYFSELVNKFEQDDGRK